MSHLVRAAAVVMLLAAGRAGAEPGAGASAAATERSASARAIAAYLRARLALGRGDLRAAAEALAAAVTYDPASPQLRSSHADVQARLGRLDAALAEARKAVELAGPRGAAAADAHLVLGKVLGALGRGDAAVEALEKAAQLEGERLDATPPDGQELRVDPEPWRALARARLDRGDGDGADRACEELARRSRPQGASTLRELAVRALDAKDVPAATRRLLRAVELSPTDVEAWKMLARVQEEQRRLEDARRSWERALALEPEDGEALLSAGALALRQGDVAAARAWFRQLLRVAPDEALVKVRVAAAWLDARAPADALETASGDEPEVLYLRGLALAQLKRWDDAAAVLARVAPGTGAVYPAARATLGHVLWRAGRPDEAVRAVREALERTPRDPGLLFALGECYDRAGQRAKALEQMRAVLAVKPDHAEAANYLGYAYAERGERLDEAQALVERALRMEPENGAFLDSLGWVLFKRGEVVRAVEVLERADALSGAEPTVLEHLGDAYRAAKRPDDAAAAYRRALEVADGADEEPGEAPGARRASVQRKLDEVAGAAR